MSASPTIHACAILLGESGILITGRAGAGKSTLALQLIRYWQLKGRFARLIADDRVFLEEEDIRLIAKSPIQIAGLIEVRALGIQSLAYEREGIIDLIVELGEKSERMPEWTEHIPRRLQAKNPQEALHLIEAYLEV